MTTFTTQLHGRTYQVTLGGDDQNPETKGSLSTYNEVILEGVRGARYWSVRPNDSRTFSLYKDGRNDRLPGEAFKGDLFVIALDQDHGWVVRPATYKDIVNTQTGGPK